MDTTTHTAKLTPVYVAGNGTVHAGRAIGTYASGATRYAKLCGTSRRDNHEPMPIEDATTAVTCKRCLAKMPTHAKAAAAPAHIEAAARQLAHIMDFNEAKWPEYVAQAEAIVAAADKAREAAHSDSLRGA